MAALKVIPAMAQTSITSFFAFTTKKPASPAGSSVKTPEKRCESNGNASDEPDGDSPVKQQRKRCLVIASDSEDESPSPKGTPPTSLSPDTATLRKTARKTVGGQKSTESKQKRLLEERKLASRAVKSESIRVKAEDADDKLAGDRSPSPTSETSGTDRLQLEDPTHSNSKRSSQADKSAPRSKPKTNGKNKSTTPRGRKSKGAGADGDKKKGERDEAGRKRKSEDEEGGSTKRERPSVTKAEHPSEDADDSQLLGRQRKAGGEEDANHESGGNDDAHEEEGEGVAEQVTQEEKGSGARSPKSSRSPKPSTGIFGLQSSREAHGPGKVDCNEYDPLKKNYHPVDDAVWKEGQTVPYLALARTFELVEVTSARLKMIDILANYLRSVVALSPHDLLPSVYLCLNQLAPAYHGLELGIGDGAITRAIAAATGRTVDKIRADVAERGDLGLVAESSKTRQRVMFQPAPLTVAGVFRTLTDIAQMTGQAVMTKKVGKMQALMVACRHSETRFIVRSLSGKLRIGLAEQSVLQALAQACVQTPPEQPRPARQLDATRGLSADKAKARLERAALTLKTTYCECPCYDEIVPALLRHGVAALPDHCRIRTGVPLKPMLAHPTRGVSEVLARFEGTAFTCEYKYDGERAQIHLLDDGSVRVYSRNQEDNTSKYPDIVARFRACLTDNVSSCILDSEAVAWDRQRQQILPFQVLSTRKRKDAAAADIKVQVCVFAFDLLMLNGESLVTQPFRARRDQLRASFAEVDGQFAFARSNDGTDVEQIAEFLDESVRGNCEGLMVKTLDRDATYEIAKRSRNWLKLKKDYLDGVGDTIDVVVIGGFLGKGKRSGKYGGFLLACYDPDNEEFQSICKIGTGFSDDDLERHSTLFAQHKIDSAKSYYRYSVEPDQWFEAAQVWEIKCADLSVSPVHKAAVGIVDPERGISLRFPRFLRVRDDKKPEQATSAQQIADMYRNQDQVKNQTAKPVDEEEFY